MARPRLDRRALPPTATNAVDVDARHATAEATRAGARAKYMVYRERLVSDSSVARARHDDRGVVLDTRPYMIKPREPIETLCKFVFLED